VDLEDEIFNFDARVQQHGLDEAQRILREKKGEMAEEIIAAYLERVGDPLRDKHGLISPDQVPWYVPLPDAQSPRWSFAKKRLGLDEAAVARTSRIADEILARLANPRGKSITTRGLVLGHVQSGKTTSFLSVAAKALDSRYDLVIILSGVHNSLRRQTQNRAARTLVHNPSLWWLGTALNDFRPDGNSLSSHLAGNGKRGLLVVKKRADILQKLATWLEKETDAALRKLAILVIDDEADQAGLDVAKGSELEGVHKQLSRIVNLRTSDDERRCAYLAYTATPYANILTSQEKYGLYPRDFIYPLEPPDSYVGIEELFGSGQVGDPVQIEEDSDSGDFLTGGLRDAIRWFVVATAARVGLGSALDSFNSSMLIHTTQSTDEQKAYRPEIEGFLSELDREFMADTSTMKSFYERVLAQVPSRVSNGSGFLGERTAAWSTVEPHVRSVLRRLIDRTPAGEPFKEDGHLQQAHSGVIVDNSKVDHMDRLTYSDTSVGEKSVTVIAVGGNTLSRGLTLEGLVCSYFARTARNYDSLMQMGRWFGYRPGYRHLLRIWTTQGLFDWFQELSLVEQDLRNELIWMQENGITPDEYGPRIRTSPNMNITRAAAMKSVARKVSYSDRVIDPAWLELSRPVLHSNQELARDFAQGLGRSEMVGSSRLFRGIDQSRVRTFLEHFQVHPEEKRLDKPSLKSYLDLEARNLSAWNVIFKSNSLKNTSTFDFGGDVGEVATIKRSRIKHASIALIGSLVDSEDHRMDCDGAEPIGGARYRSSSEPPLLIIYAIDKVSEPSSRRDRVALNAETTPLSISLVLPQSNSFVEYVAPVVKEIDQSTTTQDMGVYAND
jgi:hypothetical protein